MTTRRVDRPQAVATLSDDLGVLSAYLTVRPGAADAARLAVDQQLGDLTGRTEVRERVRDLRPVFDRLLDPALPGRGRAVFAPLSRPGLLVAFTQLPLTTAAAVDDIAHLRPLVAAHSAGRPAGIAAVAAHGIRVVEVRLGLARDVGTTRYTAPGRYDGLRDGVQQDVRLRRVAEHVHHFLRGAGAHLATTAAERHWRHLVVTGDAELVAALAGGLPGGADPGVVRATHVAADGISADAVAALVAGELTDARRREDAALAGQARDAALAGGAGAYGIADVTGALAAGRVRHLLLDDATRWPGWRTADGRLWPAHETPPSPALGVADLSHRLVVQTYRQGGEVTVLPAAALAAAGGVAALLRW
ncbi:baeRF10 domain-containing protein [Spirilliplanes yamanashiensis]|uniref:Uncharacterized protein n=1 Tax=Spirilliplanes yamanashiensis TaxID=42233 RepID=A0A8J3YDE2_9ACTN|nr:hypothetical protein [Spirilliplanes yamanashiensis]MDP9818324.1 hypothetical protein [Spirilliplanes yamanashiensis]GIJ06543.1 hypothetical protein Sya03_58950 [Spirilliplanes yamanashiensis]